VAIVEPIKAVLLEIALNPLVAAILLMVLCLGAIRIDPLRNRLQRVWARYGRLMLVTAAAGILTVHVLTVGWYLLLPGFADDLEPLVSSTSWLVEQGHPMYHAFAAPERYSVLYGPMSYLTNGLIMKLFGPSLVTAKLGSALAALLGLCFLYLAYRRLGRPHVALVLTALAALLYGLGGPISYMVRPDALLIAAVSFGLLCALRSRPPLGVIGLAVAIGFAANLKVHAGLFFLPILVLCAHWGRRNLLLVLGGALAVFLMPFVFHPQISARNYVVWLLEATRHGLDIRTFAVNLHLGLFLGLPLMLLLPGNKEITGDREQKAFLLSLVISALGMAILASKPGAGLKHMLPLVPLILYGCARLMIRLRSTREAWMPALSPQRLGAGLGLVLVILITGSVTQYRFLRVCQLQNLHGQEISRDIDRILDSYPDCTIGMAYGGENGAYRLTSYRPLLVFAGNPVLLDAIAVMEERFSGRSLPPPTYEALATGQIAIWLVPRSREPFHKRNWYPGHEEIFPEELRRVFRRFYHLRDRSRYFDLWFHADVPAEVGALLDPGFARPDRSARASSRPEPSAVMDGS
jgi:hypothetical protein